jgi:GNAT superfamily N-acetyltransferase
MKHEASADAARARFEAATAAHLRGALTEEVTIEPVGAAEWGRHYEATWAEANARAPVLDVARLTSEDDRAAYADLDAVLGQELEHRLLLKAGDEVVGVYWGHQQAFGRYYMVSSAIHPRWQRRGLYRALLGRVLAAATASGFREIYSRHRADNNAVLVPKLQAGFAIAAFEITPRHGLLVHLRYYPGAGPRLAFEYRIDGAHADELRARGVLAR